MCPDNFPAVQYADEDVLFVVQDGATLASLVRPPKGHLLARLRGVYSVGGDDEDATLTLDDAEAVDAPAHEVDLSEVNANPRRFDGAHAILEGYYQSSFEGGALNGVISLTGCWNIPLEHTGEEGLSSAHLRVEGWLFPMRHPGPPGIFRYRYAFIADDCTAPPLNLPGPSSHTNP